MQLLQSAQINSTGVKDNSKRVSSEVLEGPPKKFKQQDLNDPPGVEFRELAGMIWAAKVQNEDGSTEPLGFHTCTCQAI